MRLHIFVQKAVIAIYTLTYIVVLAELDLSGFYVTIGIVANTLSTFLSNMILPKIAPNMNVRKGVSIAFIGLALSNILILSHSPIIVIFSSLIAIPSSFFIYYIGYYNVKHNILNRENGLKGIESANNLGFIAGYLIALIFTKLYGYLLPVYIAIITSISILILSTSSIGSVSGSRIRLNEVGNIRSFLTNLYPNGYTSISELKINIKSLSSFFTIKERYKRITYFLALISASIGFSYTYLTPYLVLNGIESYKIYLFTLIASSSTYISTELSIKVYNGFRSISRMLIPRILSYVSTVIFLLFLTNLADISLFIMYIPIGFSWGFLLTLYSYLTSRVDSQEHSKINFYTGIINLISVGVAGIVFYNYGLYLDLIIATVFILAAFLIVYKNPYVIKGWNSNQHLLHIYLNRMNRVTLRKKTGR